MANTDLTLCGGVQTGGIATDSKTNATATATLAAPAAGQCWLITKAIVSASAAPAAAVQATVQHGTGPTASFTFRIPASATWPVSIDFGTHPLVLPESDQAQLTVPALGAGVVCDIALFGIKSSI